MIAHLKGSVLEAGIVETADGVGYAVTTADDLEVGADVSLRITTIVRETDISLWGFQNLEDQQVFQALLKVSGVGPTAAMAVVRELGAPELVRVVEAEDVKAFKPVPGVGPSTAKKIISTIKLPAGVASAAATASTALRDEVASALRGLGYPSALVDEVTAKVAAEEPEAQLGELISAATVEIALRTSGGA